MARPRPASSPLVILCHARTDMRVMVPFSTYLRGLSGRYRNWRLARGNSVVRPCLTITECLGVPECPKTNPNPKPNPKPNPRTAPQETDHHVRPQHPNS